MTSTELLKAAEERLSIASYQLEMSKNLNNNRLQKAKEDKYDFLREVVFFLRAQQDTAEPDRSRWEGCEYCLEGKGIVTFAVPDEIEITEDDVKMGWVEEPQYCPNCGRPLTEEAWAELERRIGGNDGTADKKDR